MQAHSPGHHNLAVRQSQIPDWLTEEVLSLPITTPHHEIPPAAPNATQLNESETFNSRDPDTSHSDPCNHHIQVHATELILI